MRRPAHALRGDSWHLLLTALPAFLEALEERSKQPCEDSHPLAVFDSLDDFASRRLRTEGTFGAKRPFSIRHNPVQPPAWKVLPVSGPGSSQGQSSWLGGGGEDPLLSDNPLSAQPLAVQT